MKGGDPKFSIPEYKTPIPVRKEATNDPMIPNEQKRILQQKMAHKEKPDYSNNTGYKPQQPKPMLELKMYQPPKPKPKPKGKFPHPGVFQPVAMPNPMSMNPLEYAHYLQNNSYNMGYLTNPVYNEYTINIGGVTGSHVAANMIYEDALPVKNITATFCTLGERITLYEYIKNTMFAYGDGEDVPIESTRNNLLSHLKFMDLNPYNVARYTNNPYKGLPFGFLLYRSCYPIKHDTRISAATCARNSTGINVRLYRMTEGCYAINKQNRTKQHDYDEWRDIAFYEYIREHIIKQKICPNFVTLYGYNISINSGIDYDGLLKIQEKIAYRKYLLNNKVTGTVTNNRKLMFAPIPGTNRALPVFAPDNSKEKKDQLLFKTNQDLNKNKGKLVVHDRNLRTGNQSISLMNAPQSIHKNTAETGFNRHIALDKYLGKSLVCLTDAPNYNLLGWAKKEYRTNGNIKTMVNTGYHSEAVWMSVLFQLLAALYVMQKHGIIINNFKIDRNVFIKDININGKVTNYWKYIIDGIEYYVPNYGYLVLIDTNFRDYDESCLKKELDPNRIRKIDGKILGDACTMSDTELYEKSFEMCKEVIDTNVFDTTFINDCGVPPPEKVKTVIKKISNELHCKPTSNIGYYIRKFMTPLMNNRIGTLLNEQEILNVKGDGVKEFRKGQIVVYKDQNGSDRFALHIETKENGISRIITTDSIDPQYNNTIEKEVQITLLKEYSIVESIKQKFNMNEADLNEDALLETYRL